MSPLPCAPQGSSTLIPATLVDDGLAQDSVLEALCQSFCVFVV